MIIYIVMAGRDKVLLNIEVKFFLTNGNYS
jgi:hypothetical protein